MAVGNRAVAAGGVSFWEGRAVLVTGATGFIGSWLVKELLALGAEVTALVLDTDPRSELSRSGDVDRIRVVDGALEDLAAVERALDAASADTVFHLGAQTLVGVAEEFPLETLESNVRGTYHVLDACRRRAGVVGRLVVASSDKAYGAQDELPYTEDMPLRGARPYEVSKSCADLIAQAYAATYDLPLAVTRFGNVYGGGDLNWSRIVPGTIRSLLLHESPVIRSDGSYERDYLYVKDVVRAYLVLAEEIDDARVRGRVFNFGPNEPLTVFEIVRQIQQQMQAADVVLDVRDSAGGEIRSQYLASDRAREMLGWQPQYTLADGLRETIEWYRRLHAEVLV